MTSPGPATGVPRSTRARWFRLLGRSTLVLLLVGAPVAWTISPGLDRFAPAYAATPSAYSADGSGRFQRMDGFGVTANPDNWRGGQLVPALDTLVDTLNARIWRVEFDGFT